MLELLWMVLIACAGAHAAPSVTNLATVNELINKLSAEPADTPVFLVQIRDGNNQPDFIFDGTINTATSNSPSNNNVYILRLFETPKPATTTTTTTPPPPVVTNHPCHGCGHHHHHGPHRHHHRGSHRHHHHGRRGKRQQFDNFMEVDDLDDLRGQMTEIHQSKSLYVVIIKSGDDEGLPLLKSLRDRLQTSLRTIYVSRLSAETGILTPILSTDIKTTAATIYTVPTPRPTTQAPPVVHVHNHNHRWHKHNHGPGHKHHHGHHRHRHH